uniref:FBA_2 domain-containing protein n=1 Tax=Steinernema glaseri TaxID=37863 RepID=A0A1I7ZWX1_9BILA
MDVMKNIWPYTYEELLNGLTGRWKAAAGRYAENTLFLSITIYCEDGEWGYATYMCGQEISYEDLLALDRRFVRCTSIDVCNEPDTCDFPFPCSKEKLFNQVIPFFIQRSSPFSGIQFLPNIHGIEMEHARMYLKSLRSYIDLGLRETMLKLSYYGQESEDFVAAWVDSNHCNRSVILDTSWPQTQAIEDLVLKYLRRKNYINFFIFCSTSEIEGHLKMNAKLLEATLDTWSKLDNDSFFTVGGAWSKDVEDLLSIPLPPNVTREEPTMDGEKVSTIEWTKEDGATLQCKIVWDICYDFISFTRSSIAVDE